MAVINLQIVVPNIESVLVHFDRIKVYRSINGVAGTYIEITTALTRLVLESAQTVYEYTDNSGDANYYYKSSYLNAGSGLESSLSDAQQGESDPALDIISVEELKTNYLFGLDLTDDSGTPYPNSLYEWFIKSAVSWVEHRLDLPIRPKTIEDEKHDFYREDYENFMWLRAKEYPLIDVEQVSMVLPGQAEAIVFDREWLQVQKENGQIQIVPGMGAINTLLLGISGLWHPFLYRMNRFMPNVFRVDYTAGFEELPHDIRDLVGKVASFGPLNIAGDLLGGAGIASQSLSIDGLSSTYNTTSSATNAGYGARLLQYSKEAKEVVPTLRRYYKGFGLTVV